MGAGEHFLTFHHHVHHDVMKKDDHKKNIPKGCVTVMVGHEDEEKKRFVIPVMYMNHPLFLELLKEAEEEYGFQNQGPIIIPCRVQDFCNVQRLIEKGHRHPYYHNNHHPICCFKD
ncbi:hypothetical protein L2E82_21925 [Cichorium intybus]|uniref:Uncharacterized protein n=1 Tax=Cichorium intybus TaxID=13427 RepID=A0ACB9DX29_CICIN|nr:hypothetical protein L2E82_21925 [Cichorium intybus]